MPKTVAEILKETGLTDEQIGAIDAKVIEGLTAYSKTASDTLEKAELVSRAQREEYDQRIAPALAKWADRDTIVTTENAALKAFVDKVKDSGYLPPEMLAAIPSFGSGQSAQAPPNNPGGRGPNGQFVTGANPVPGSPGFVDADKIRQSLSNDLGTAFSFAADTAWRYRSLFGKEMPDSPTALIREASAQRMTPGEYAAKKYNFVGRETEMKAEEQKKHDDAIRKEATDAANKEWSERMGSNPNVRMPAESAFSQISRARAEGKRQDPLKMTPDERKANTHSNIQKEFAEHSSRVQ